MKLEQQVCSLELAKRLKELGVRQESVFAHYDGKILAHDEQHSVREYGGAACSAFTVAELGEMLPQFITKTGRNEARQEDWSKTYSLYTYKERGTSFLRYIRATEDGTVSKYDYVDCLHEALGIEADARARMLIHLLGNNLFTPQSVQ